MEDYQKQFIEFAIQQGVLRFGEFKLKSGRLSPYFFNAGLFNSGGSVAKLGQFYAQAIQASGIDFDMIFGPAYKGIPLSTTTAVALANDHQRDVPFAFNRKEAKDHGEGGTIVGAPLAGKTLIIDDVISAGTSVRESFELIEQAGASVAGVAIALDRQEKGLQDTSAIDEIKSNYGIPVISIINLADLLMFLKDDPTLAQNFQAVASYRDQYGAN